MLSGPPKFEHVLGEVLTEVGAFRVLFGAGRQEVDRDYRVVRPDGSEFDLEVKQYKRLTPASAHSACLTLKRHCESTRAQPVLYAPVVSDRTADIATEYGVSWIDYAGNCRLVFPQYGIYVRRSGVANPYGKQLPKVLNVFSSKSSRVVRAMLEDPLRGWQLNELASHPDVRISPGLMSRIKRSLVEDAYASMVEGRLRLKRPDDLLDDWVQHYQSHKPREYAFYMRGEVEQVEQQIADWCSKTNSEYALSRFSAAWRLAPEVRYSVASFLVSPQAILADPFIALVTQYGARKVESGANLILQVTEDQTYFFHRVEGTLPTTSPLQTYLDLMVMDGRGQDAARAIYEKYLKQKFSEASESAMNVHEGG